MRLIITKLLVFCDLCFTDFTFLLCVTGDAPLSKFNIPALVNCGLFFLEGFCET